MFAARLVVTGELKLSSPLHLGTGEVESYDSIPQDPESKDKVPTTVATVMRDVDGMPVIPGASVKGVLRALVAGHDGVNALCGPPTGGEEAADGTKKKLYQGRLTASAMRYVSSAPATLAHGLPFAEKKMPDGVQLQERGLFIAARTAIDPGSGTAEEGKLFHQEMVAPGARFGLRLVLRLQPDDGGAAEACLIAALKALTRDDGVAFGKGQSLGQGRMRLVYSTLQAERLAFDPARGVLCDSDAAETTRQLKKTIDAAQIAPTERLFARYELRLTCDGPFLIDDTSIKPGKKSEKPRLNAQQWGDKPLLSGSTLIGALRARTGWLAKLRWNEECKRRDERGRILAKGDEAARLADPERVVTDPGKLSPTERLFGVTGWRGLVRVAGITCTNEPGFENITSVKLDRFSMAPIDGALFTTRAAIDPVFEVVLEVEQRGGFPDEDDRQLLAGLLVDLREEGLMLGHGTSRGYGWFGVEYEQAKAEGTTE